MDIYNFFKDQYFFEISRKDQLMSYMSMPTLVIITIGGIVGFFLQNYNFMNLNLITVFFIIFLLITIFFLFRTTFYLFRSYLGYKYNYIPYSEELLKYYNELEEYYKDNENESNTALEDFKNVIIEKYAFASNINSKNNDSKSEYLHQAIFSLVFALIFCLFSSIPFFINQYSKNDNVIKIEITNLNDVSQKLGDIMSSNNSNQKPKPKPVPPPNRNVREGEQPPKPKKNNNK